MSTEKTEKQYRDEIAILMKEYHEVADKLTAGEIREKTIAIAKLRAELIAMMSTGCIPCPLCSKPALAMLKTPAHMHRGEEKPPTYEVGCTEQNLIPCPTCANAEVSANAGCPDCGETHMITQHHPRSRHWTLEGAKERWNAGIYVKS